MDTVECACGRVIYRDIKWNGVDYITKFYRLWKGELKEITHCPKCGEWLPKAKLRVVHY